MISLGIDIGTTSICAVLYDLTQDKVIKSLSDANSFMKTGSYLQEPDMIVLVVKRLLDELGQVIKQIFDKNGALPVGVGISSQMHGILYTDNEGRAITPLYTWKNEDGNKEYQDGFSYAQYLTKKTGMPFYSGYGSVTHFYLQKNHLIPPNAIKFMGIGDYVAMRLTGTKSMAAHRTMADSFGGFRLDMNQFDLKVLTSAGVDTSYYPDIADCQGLIAGHIISGIAQRPADRSTWSDREIKEKNIPVLYALGDNQASFLGAVKNKAHTISINVGTGSQVSVYGTELSTEIGSDIRPWVEMGYLYVGASLNGGKVYECLAAFFEEVCEYFTGQKVPVYELMERLAKDKKETTLYAVPTLYGSREQRGSGGKAGIYGLNSTNFHPEDFIRSFTAGMARELYSLYCSFPDTVRIGKTQIMASGNGIRKNAILREEVEKIFGLPVIFTDREEEAAAGAALYACQMVREGEMRCG